MYQLNRAHNNRFSGNGQSAHAVQPVTDTGQLESLSLDPLISWHPLMIGQSAVGN
jgi:hypothetical protein